MDQPMPDLSAPPVGPAPSLDIDLFSPETIAEPYGAYPTGGALRSGMGWSMTPSFSRRRVNPGPVKV